MAKKIFTYRAKTMEELVKLSEKEFSEFTQSTIRRSINRGLDKKLLATVNSSYEKLQLEKEPKIIRTHLRDFPILPKMVGLKFAVYNGKEFVIFQVMEKMLGHYLGEFVLTRKRLSHGKAGIGATKSSTAITARGWNNG